MKIAVTGGSGFVGHHVVKALGAAGHEVIVLDVARGTWRSAVEWSCVDILDLDAVLAATSDIEAIVHLAGVSNVNEALAGPVDCVQRNVTGTAHVLEAARVHSISHVVLASTIWVYSATLDRRPNEDSPLSPSGSGHVYTFSKIAAELLCREYQQLYGVDYTILRYGIVYGPGMRRELLLAALFEQALAGRPIVIHGDGSQSRNFVYVEDLAAAHVLAIETDAARNHVFNVAGTQHISVREVAENVRRLVGPHVDVTYGSARRGDWDGQYITSEKAARLLGCSAGKRPRSLPRALQRH